MDSRCKFRAGCIGSELLAGFVLGSVFVRLKEQIFPEVELQNKNNKIILYAKTDGLFEKRNMRCIDRQTLTAVVLCVG